MKNYIIPHPWKIVEEGFEKQNNKVSESLFSLGNGHMGQRGNFEETFTGPSLQGSYMAGVYYPDKTIVGWWKNGYPDYFAKVLNSTNWIGLSLQIKGQEIDLATGKIEQFRRELDMRRGVLTRTCRLRLDESTVVEVESRRFVSMARPEIGTLQYSLTLKEGTGPLALQSRLDGNVHNEDANYNEFFWEHREEFAHESSMGVVMSTKKTGFVLAVQAQTRVVRKVSGGDEENILPENTAAREGRAFQEFSLPFNPGDTVVIEKTAACLTDRDHPAGDLVPRGRKILDQALEAGFEALEEEQALTWEAIWDHSDIAIQGDPAAQQGIRFNIFQLNQTYTGRDKRLNIGPKGFTGEKYGGAAYWDTEAYCLPFFLNTADSAIARQLLLYRHNHLDKARENAEKLGFTGGAALFPMVTMNGEECHNEWEITFEEIHRNGAIAYAIHHYVSCTGDRSYLIPWGMEVLTGIARFWVQRVNWSEEKKQYVILGVTGPNEYENNVPNNWYTNYLAAWCLRYTAETAAALEREEPDSFRDLTGKIGLTREEREWFITIAENIYLPRHEEKGLILQQDGFLDKEIRSADSLPPEERPLNQHWSWDRILRSCFIKQADVLQGLYFFEDAFDREEIRRNFDFYEPLTVHESSLSPCIHSILASRLGYDEKAYDLYLRTARLDLDDYNNDTEDGCHITSMAGTWMAVVEGFGGLRRRQGHIYLNPRLPAQWESYSFKLVHRDSPLKVQVSRDTVALENHGSREILLRLGVPEHYEILSLNPGEKASRPRS